MSKINLIAMFIKCVPGTTSFYRCGMQFTDKWKKVEVDEATGQRLYEEQMLVCRPDAPEDYEPEADAADATASGDTGDGAAGEGAGAAATGKTATKAAAKAKAT